MNVLLYASSPRTKHHDLCRDTVNDLVSRGEPFGVSELVLSAVVRIATSPRAFDPPASPEKAIAFADALREHPEAVRLEPGPRHWDIFKDLVLSTGIRGSDTTDAWLAALALEHGCEWWTTDSGFERFPGLRWRNLLKPLPSEHPSVEGHAPNQEDGL